jgi:RimJ/RimL family protein N-acetyltransferase
VTTGRRLIDPGGVDELRTERLRLRRWRPEDEAEMTRINQEPEVGRYLNRPVDPPAVAAFHGLVVRHWQEHGFGRWAVESLEPGLAGRFLGFAGLAYAPVPGRRRPGPRAGLATGSGGVGARAGDRGGPGGPRRRP